MSLQEWRRAQATSFGVAAEAYERGRPPYPDAAIDWLVPPHATRVLDLGAGTGKLTRQLHERGLDVIAVEPSAGMRDQLRRAVPGVPVLGGKAEQLPLAAGSVDAILVAQAWHWVEPSLAIPEAARVLAPGGRLGLLWNRRVEGVDWVSELSAIMGSSRSPDAGRASPQIPAPFGPVERFNADWVHHLSPEAMIDWVASRSYVITLPEAQRESVLGQVRRLLDDHPSVTGGPEIAIRMVTRCTRADLPGQPGQRPLVPCRISVAASPPCGGEAARSG
jgi:SAM-dependent methyltransferase